MPQITVELICSPSDSCFALAMLLQLRNYIAKEDDDKFYVTEVT